MTQLRKFKREFHIEQIFKIESKTVHEYLERNDFPWKVVTDWKFIIYFAKLIKEIYVHKNL